MELREEIAGGCSGRKHLELERLARKTQVSMSPSNV
jgi:hypothetical protein